MIKVIFSFSGCLTIWAGKQSVIIVRDRFKKKPANNSKAKKDRTNIDFSIKRFIVSKAIVINLMGLDKKPYFLNMLVCIKLALKGPVC